MALVDTAVDSADDSANDSAMPLFGDYTDLLSGRSAARLARLLRKQEVGSSNLPAPTISYFNTTSYSARSLLILAVFLCFAVAVPAAKADPTTPAIYEVHKGDNLSLIAKRFGTSVAALKGENNLNSDVIHIGQKLKLAQPFKGMGRSSVQWLRPVRHPGQVLRPFGPYKAGGILMPRTGTELACAVGTQLYSPAIGVVRYSGPMEGFGHLLIIEHPGRYATVLSPCDPSSVTVTVGQAILRGERLGKTSSPPEAGDKPFIHIELRRDDKAIPPDRLFK